MRLAQLELGRESLLDVDVEGAVPAAWTPGMEVCLRLRGSIVVLEGGGETVPVQATRSSAAELDLLTQQQLPRVVRLADLTGRLRLQVRTFQGALPDLDVDIGVDEPLLEKARKLNPRLRTLRDLMGWLTDQVFLQGDPVRAFLSSGHDATFGDHWVLHGRTVRVDAQRVRREDGSADVVRVKRVVRGRRSSDRHPIFLATGRMRFVNASEEARLRLEARASLEQIRASADSFMALWKRYGDLEAERILQRARDVGAIRYVRTEQLENGYARFVLKHGAGLDDALRELKEGDQLEATENAPEVITNPERTFAEYLKGAEKTAPPPGGAIVGKPRSGEDTITLRPRDIEGFHAPKAGILHLSVRGDATRFSRRDDARKRVWSAEARMPQLAQLLEGAPVSSRAMSTAEMPASVRRKIFPNHPPTPDQEDAIRAGLQTPDVAVIQGPPGTGKTTVIRAIVESLNALANARIGTPGHILVAGFQHVAVENAIGGMSVNGLPAIKFGGKGTGVGLREIDERIESWRLERVAAIRQSLPRHDHAELRRRLGPLVEGYLSAPTGVRETRELLTEIAGLAAGVVPGALMDSIHALNGALGREARDRDDSGQLDQLITALRAIRSTKTSWEDDGGRNVAYLLALDRAAPRLDREERVELSRALAGPPSPAGLRSLGALRRRALLRLLRGRSRSEGGARIRVDVARVLVEVREAVERATRPLREGPDAVSARYLAELDGDPIAVRGAVLRYTPVYAATCQQAAGREAATAKNSSLEYQSVIVDEAARANPLDLLIPMSQARRRLILVGDHRQLPHMVDEQILQELGEGHDEATAKDRVEQAIRDSLFERLFTDFDQRRTEPVRVVTLNDQFRMHPVLGEFVSSQFYEGNLRSPLKAEGFRHGLEDFKGVPAAWLEVPHGAGGELQGRSKARPAEAEVLADLLPRLMTSAEGQRLSFGVISFYSRQVDLIGEKLARQGLMEPNGRHGYRVIDDWRWLEKPAGKREARLEVGSVDAFQGREFDVVFLSVVRSSTLPDNTAKQRRARYGHLMSPNRLCVAMSRQKKLLVAVGDPSLLTAPHAEDAIGPLVRFHALCSGEAGRVL